MKLDNNGNILVPTKQLSLSQHIHNNNPHMAMDSLQYLHVVWDTDSAGVFPTMYTKLDTLGDFVIPPIQVVYPPYTPGGGGARIAVDFSNRLHLVWVDGRVNPGVTTDIFYKRGENETGVHGAIRLDAVQTGRLSVSPNPFSKMTKIKLEFSQNAETVKFEIFDIMGRQVRQFMRTASESFTCWDGTDELGDYLAAGVYFLHASSREGRQTIPIVLLR